MKAMVVFDETIHLSEKLNIVTKVNDISNRMLETRRFEKNYLLYNDRCRGLFKTSSGT